MAESSGRDAEWGTTAAAGALMFLLLRLLAVSHYDWKVAFALADCVDFEDSIGVLVGTFLGNGTLTCVLLALLLPLLMARVAERRGRGGALIVAALAGLLVSGLISLHAWPLLGAALLSSALMTLALRRRGVGRDVAERVLARLGVVVAGAALLLAGLSDTPWVPEERITLRSGTVAGYVMQAGPVSVKILTAGGREIEIVPARDVVSRVEVD